MNFRTLSFYAISFHSFSLFTSLSGELTQHNNLITVQKVINVADENLWQSLQKASKKNSKTIDNLTLTISVSPEYKSIQCTLTLDNIKVSEVRLSLRNNKKFYIEWVGTHLDYRRKGYASILLQELLDLLKEVGVPYVDLKSYTYACPLYQKLGFYLKKNELLANSSLQPMRKILA